MSPQKTLKTATRITGIGVHTGESVTLTLHPAPINTGIIFRRDNIDIPATIHYIGDTDFCTCLVKDGKRIATIEHMLSALHALQIDNCIAELTLDELPIFDGSARPF